MSKICLKALRGNFNQIISLARQQSDINYNICCRGHLNVDAKKNY